MRRITKGPPPAVIAELRRTPGATWASVHGDQKQAMREAAHLEQRGLCAYCTRRLTADSSTTLEHWLPRSDPSCDPFGWPDLLAVCPGGGERAAKHDQSCDRRRGNQPLTLHPVRATPDVEAVVRFRADGRLRIDDDALRAEATDRLGLDIALLVRARKGVIDAITDQINAAHRLPRQADRLKRLRNMLAVYTAPSGDLPPFPTVVLPLLQRAVQQAEDRGRRLRRKEKR